MSWISHKCEKIPRVLNVVDFYIQELHIISEALLFIDDNEQVSDAAEKNAELLVVYI